MGAIRSQIIRTFSRDEEAKSRTTVFLLCLRCCLPESLEQLSLILLAYANAGVLDRYHEVKGIAIAPLGGFCGIKVESFLVLTEIYDVRWIRSWALSGGAHGYCDLPLALLPRSELDGIRYQVD